MEIATPSMATAHVLQGIMARLALLLTFHVHSTAASMEPVTSFLADVFVGLHIGEPTAAFFSAHHSTTHHTAPIQMEIATPRLETAHAQVDGLALLATYLLSHAPMDVLVTATAIATQEFAHVTRLVNSSTVEPTAQ
jgi:hypothetical protein